MRPGTVVKPRTSETHIDPLPALEGERKQVTVLIADIKGSLEMLAGRDPEDANRLLDAVLHLMMDAVHRYEGTVSQARGDGVMAIFGAPMALEDHAVRACYAALNIQGAVNLLSERVQRDEGISVQVRIGLNSGEVLMRAMRNDMYMEYTAVGQTVHLAGRMEQLALPGKIFATAHTVRLAQPRVDTRALGPVQVRGMGNAVEVHEITGADLAGSRLPFVRGRGLTPFVGRAAEIEMLRGALVDAEAGLGQMVAVVGEAGIGKSRLIHEFVHMAENAEWNVIECSANGPSLGRSYAPFIEMLRVCFRIGDTDSTAVIRDKLGNRLAQGGAFDPAHVPPLLDMLDALPPDHRYLLLDPQHQRQAIFQAMTHLVQFESQQQPVMILMEALDQNDSLGMQLLEHLVAQIQQERVLVIGAQRPLTGHEERPHPPGLVLRLQALDADDFTAFMEGLLGDDPSMRAIKPFLRQQAPGHPFFAEEIVRALTEAGVLSGHRGAYQLAGPMPDVKLPETVQALLAARIDRVQAEDKRILQCAAVVGTQVPFSLLRAITGLPPLRLRKALTNLVSAELLVESQLFPEAEYSFNNRLTHEVAYAELLRSQRITIHAQIVDAIESLHVHRQAEWLEPLAHHAFQGQRWDKALVYLRQAATRAHERQAHAEAAALYERALLAVDQMPKNRESIVQAIDLRFGVRSALESLGEHAKIAQYLREAETLARSIDDPLRLGWQASHMAYHQWLTGEVPNSEDCAARALEIARSHDDLPLQVNANVSMGLLLHARGEFSRAMEHLGWTVARLQGEHLRHRFGTVMLPSTYARSLQAWCMAELGDFAQARAMAEAAERIAVELNYPFSAGYALFAQGVVHLRQGEIVRAVLALQRALNTPGILASPISTAYVGCHLGFAMTLADRADDGMEILSRNTAMAEAKGFMVHHAMRLGYMAETHLRGGRSAQAQAVAERALHLAQAHGEAASEAYTRRILAECALALDHPEDALHRYTACLEAATRLRMRPLMANCHDGLARITGAMGDFVLARRHRDKADRLAESMDMQLWTAASVPQPTDTWLPPRVSRH